MKERKFGSYLAVWLFIFIIIFSFLYGFVIYFDRIGYESTIMSNLYVRVCNPNVSMDGEILADYDVLPAAATASTIDKMVTPEDKVYDFFIYNRFERFMIKATRAISLFRTYNLRVMNEKDNTEIKRNDNICTFDYDLYYVDNKLVRIQNNSSNGSVFVDGDKNDPIPLEGDVPKFYMDSSYITNNSSRVQYDFIVNNKDILFPTLLDAATLDKITEKDKTELLYKDTSLPYKVLYDYNDPDLGSDMSEDDLISQDSSYLFRSGEYMISYCRSDHNNSVTLIKVKIARAVPYLDAEFAYFSRTTFYFYSAAIIIGVFIAIIRYRRYKHVYELITYRNNLTDNLAHNFKTPLQIISGYAENIGDTDSPEDLKRYSEAITDKVAKMNESIESILLAAKRVEKKAVRNDVGEIIGEVSSNLDNMSRVKLVVEGSAVIRCDRLILTNILTNLLDNASRYAPEGSEVKVTLKGRRVTVTNPVKNEMFVPGIGLTVATRMAENIRMTLTMKNDGKLFTAVLK